MNLLWITNLLLPEAISLIKRDNNVLRGSGGWLLGASEQLLSTGEHTLTIAAPSNLVTKLTRLESEKIVYYALPCKNERKYYPKFEAMWRNIVNNEQIDLIHLHGTEFAHGLACLRAGTGKPCVLSIQGMAEEIGYHYLDGFSIWDVIRSTSLFDLLYAGTLFKQKKKYIKHGISIEREIIRGVNHIIGRTSFDRAHALAVNPAAQYHVCNESLREEFYSGEKWSYDKCTPHSIFLSQSTYTIKGLQQVLKAMPYILAKFPDTQIRIAGNDITTLPNLRAKLMQSSYSRYIVSLMNKYNLKARVKFLGALNGEQMKQEYLNSNVFICPSSIENSPNSLGEAQILGVPCVASFVGGIPDMIPSPDCGRLYRYEDAIVLADAVCQTFEKGNNFDSNGEILVASERHHMEINKNALLDIYNLIMK
ncbi:MAG: glycosyltransferase family 4 protein [Bacteroides sp.]|nr:glycosyltransferase family 4 protein [Bacteroides sp.]MCM1447848.1 glycosyltransferase family 4 protein [Bacteroides sp.]